VTTSTERTVHPADLVPELEPLLSQL